MSNMHSEDHRMRLGHLEEEVGSLKGEIGGLKIAMTDQSGKLAGMQNQMHDIARYLEKMADRVNEPQKVNWGWLIAGVMAILGVAGAYTGVVVEPLRKDADRNWEITQEVNGLTHEIDKRLSYEEGYRNGTQRNTAP